ncbi:MAG: hypothetical protein OEY64_07910 [Nitrospinota bacterium]|nr:hypothetical protein [Nitrospinota bacterium]
MKKSCLLAFLALTILPPAVFATPSNIIRIPSGDVQPFGTFRLGIDNNTTFFVPPKSGGGALPATYGLTAGTYDAVVLQTEIGVDLREVSKDPAYFNVKFVSPEGSINDFMPALFFGGYDFGLRLQRTDYNIVYGGFAKTFSFIGRFTGGYFIGNKDLLKDRNGKIDNQGTMIGFDRRMPDINEKLWFGIDYMATNSLYGALSFGFAWSFSEAATLTIAYVRYNDEMVSPVKANLTSLQVDFDF